MKCVLTKRFETNNWCIFILIIQKFLSSVGALRVDVNSLFCWIFAEHFLYTSKFLLLKK